MDPSLRERGRDEEAPGAGVCSHAGPSSRPGNCPGTDTTDNARSPRDRGNRHSSIKGWGGRVAGAGPPLAHGSPGRSWNFNVGAKRPEGQAARPGGHGAVPQGDLQPQPDRKRFKTQNLATSGQRRGQAAARLTGEGQESKRLSRARTREHPHKCNSAGGGWPSPPGRGESVRNTRGRRPGCA